jgi:hypothetical protein
MKFTLDIEWGNDAPHTGANVAKVLREAAKDTTATRTNGDVLRDYGQGG